MDDKLLLSLIDQDENESLDFKRKLELTEASGKAEFIKDIIALANSSRRSGYLIIGVEDNKEISGIDGLDEEQVQQIAYTYITPPVKLLCTKQLLPSQSSQYIIGVIEIIPAKKPHKVARSIEKLNQNDVFVRRGSIITKASPEEIIDMHQAILPVELEIANLIETAGKHIKVKNWPSAINSYSKALDLSPSAELFLQRGNAYLSLSKSLEDSFREKYKNIPPLRQAELQRDDPNNPFHFRKNAIADFSSAVILDDGKEITVQARLARLKNDTSGQYFEEDVNWLKQNTEGKLLGEVMYLSIKDWAVFDDTQLGKHALTITNEAIALGYENVDVYLHRCYLHMELHNYGLALDDANFVLSICRTQEEQFNVLNTRADIFMEMKRFNDAYADYIKTNLHPDDYFTRMWDDQFSREILTRIGIRYLLDNKFKDNLWPTIAKLIAFSRIGRMYEIQLPNYAIADENDLKLYKIDPEIINLIKSLISK